MSQCTGCRSRPGILCHLGNRNALASSVTLVTTTPCLALASSVTLVAVPYTPYTMPEPLDLSPPDIPEPSFLETLLRYGLLCGAIFQLICILAIIFPGSKSQETDSETSEVKSAEVSKKPKMAPAPAGKKQKKETKKKR
ncbi:protein MANBAL isoform X2 [Dendropsophus ebraccatus]|uniref:protein MANBAL isoform X2 n=1 Tax=Dendropsophus ebraccatus TaxID=150705 RepID=UPI00383103CD